MALRTYTTKSGTTFEWEETEEVIQAVQKLHQIEKENTEKQ